MRVAIFGTGYVGLVTGACLAEVGNHVVCVDIDADKIRRLNMGEVPIFEPGLEPLIRQNVADGRLSFTTDANLAVDHGETIIVAVGTPPDEDGSADLSHVIAAATMIGHRLQRSTVVINKSTVPVGTADLVQAVISERLSERQVDVSIEVVSNPEFLKEGDAVNDCMRPDRIVVGSGSPESIATLRRLYAPFNRNHDRMVIMDARSAELTKYAANAMLATKISFMNEIANIAERVGADVEHVRRGIGSDPRIGWHFIYPGAGYGGSCFPKDVNALERTAREHGYAPQLLAAVEAVNDRQKDRLHDLLKEHFGNLKGRTIALWGLAFKPNTDDMREASSRRLMERLWEDGARVRAHDPEAMPATRTLYGDRDDLMLCDSPWLALVDADALVVVTEWKVFRSPDFARIAGALRQPAVFDGRNIYDPESVESAGIAYYGIGRGRSVRPPATLAIRQRRESPS